MCCRSSSDIDGFNNLRLSVQLISSALNDIKKVGGPNVLILAIRLDSSFFPVCGCATHLFHKHVIIHVKFITK